MIQKSAAGVTIDVRVIPRARKTSIAGTRQDAVLIRLAAPPVDGAANDALLRFLAETLAVPVRSIRLDAGATSREKRLTIVGARVADVRAKLGLSPSAATA